MTYRSRGVKNNSGTGRLLIGSKNRRERLNLGVFDALRTPERESHVRYDFDVVTLVLEKGLGILRCLEELGAVDKVSRLGQLGQVSDRGDRVVD